MPRRLAGIGLGEMLLCFLLFARTCYSVEEKDLSQTFKKLEVMIPMRDGTRLHTEVFIPQNVQEPLPILITRTPYGPDDDAKGFAKALATAYSDFVKDGYIFVFQDIRGRFKSEGQFVLLRPLCAPSDHACVDETTDSNDTIEWLVNNTPHNNGRAGVLGISYGGWLTVMALLGQDPHLKAVSPQASPIDLWLGDDYAHNGAFRQTYAFNYEAAMERSKELTPFEYDKYDQFAWYLALGPLSNVDKRYFFGKVPGWNELVAHPDYDEYWKAESVFPALARLHRLTIPTLSVAGWWDQEDFYGATTIYAELEKKDPDHLNYFAAGPWNHGGWDFTHGTKLGDIDFGSDTSKYFRAKIEAPWFAYWLKDKGSLSSQIRAYTFQTGSNTWESYQQWPPQEGVTKRKLYFHSAGELSFETPNDSNSQPFDSYISDPRNPVPYLPRPITDTSWTTWLVQDQRFASNRPDVLDWETGPLQQDVTVAGNIVAHLFASTSGTDSDWVVKLLDVYPEKYPSDPKMGGYELMVADEIFRARYRQSFEKPAPVTPGEVIEYTIDLHTNNHRFLTGHKIMVQVQSTWFPLYEANPQSFVPNIFQATDANVQIATQRVYRSERFPSSIEIPVIMH
jgi:putative CocE/NonD family hydrolase